MELILALRELMRRKWLVVLGALLSAVAVAGIAHMKPVKTSWSASEQLLVDDANSSALPDSARILDPLVPRAGIYAEIVTTPELMGLISKAAGIPEDQITAVGAPDDNGNSPVFNATAPSPGAYKLQFATPSPTQPLVTVTGTATTRAAAVALANGAAAGLSNYLNQLATTSNIPARRRIEIRQLGGASVVSTTTGISKSELVPIYLLILIAWCLFIVLGTRFAEAWRRSAPSAAVEPDASASAALPALPALPALSPAAEAADSSGIGHSARRRPLSQFGRARRSSSSAATNGATAVPNGNGSHANGNANGNGNGNGRVAPSDEAAEDSGYLAAGANRHSEAR